MKRDNYLRSCQATRRKDRVLFQLLGLLAAVILLAARVGQGAEPKQPWQQEWERVLTAAKGEGKVVVAVPASAELRSVLESAFRTRFGMEIELFSGRGPQNASRIASEFKAGLRNFDLFVVGSGTAEPLVQAGMVEPFEPNLILPEVKDPKYWWGGHIWEDNVSTNRFLYSFVADAGTGGLFYNSTLAKAEEFRSFDDLLDSKWKGKLGFLDPRTAGAGQSTWSFLWDIKGEEFLRKLLQQGLFVSRDQRQIADALAKGKLAVTVGVTAYTYGPFIKAGLPIRELPTPKEGLPASNGSGVIGIVKNPPHPNAAKLFVNWFLSKEGQESWIKGIRQATRRLDVDTKWLVEYGTRAAKDFLTVEEYHRVRNHLEDKINRVRLPSAKFAEQVLK